MSGVHFGMTSPSQFFKRREESAPPPGAQSAQEDSPPPYIAPPEYADDREAPLYVNSDGDRLILSAPDRPEGEERFNNWLSAQREVFEAQFPNTQNQSKAEREERFTQFLIARNENAAGPHDWHRDTNPPTLENISFRNANFANAVLTNPGFANAVFTDSGAPESETPAMRLTDRDRQFLDLIRDGDTEELHEMMRYEGVPINAHYTDRITPLHLAAMAGHPGTIELLLMNGARLNATTSQGLTPLHTAALAGNTQAVRLLIAAGANAAILDRHQHSPLLSALAQDDLDMMATLLGIDHG